MLLALLLATLLNAKEIYDVRKIIWGMSEKQVRSAEIWKLRKARDQKLHYEGILFKQPCKLIYEFDNNELINLTYSFDKAVNYEVLGFITGTLLKKYGTEYTVDNSTERTILNWTGQRTGISLTYAQWSDKTGGFLIIRYFDIQRTMEKQKRENEKIRKEADAAF